MRCKCGFLSEKTTTSPATWAVKLQGVTIHRSAKRSFLERLKHQDKNNRNSNLKATSPNDNHVFLSSGKRASAN